MRGQDEDSATSALWSSDLLEAKLRSWKVKGLPRVLDPGKSEERQPLEIS
jgi:hypothetical protein